MSTESGDLLEWILLAEADRILDDATGVSYQGAATMAHRYADRTG
jgi:hypothetical protein